MDDTVYRVITRYSIETGGAERSIARLGQSLASVGSSLTRGSRSALGSLSGGLGIAASAARSLLGPLAAIGSVAGLGRLASSALSLNDQLEQAQMSLSAILVANRVFDTMPDALGMSARLIAEMRVDAERLPGSFQELLTIVRGSMGDALGAGITPEHFRRVAGQVLGVSKVLGVSAQVAGREFGAMIEGRATRSNVLFARMRPQIGMDARSFNHLSGEQRFNVAEKALQRYGPALEAYSHTWDAISSTASDHFRELGLAASMPVFNRVKGLLADFNTWFGSHAQQLHAWAEQLGNVLVDGLDRAVALARQLAGLIHDPAALLSNALHAAPGLLAARAGLGLAGGAGAASSVLAGLGGGSALAGAGIAAVVLLPLIAAVTDGSVSLHNVWQHITGAAEPLIGTVRNLYTAFEPLLSLIGVGMFNLFTGLLDTVRDFGLTLRDVTGGLVGILHDMGRDWRQGIHDFRQTGVGATLGRASDWMGGHGAGMTRQQVESAEYGREHQIYSDEDHRPGMDFGTAAQFAGARAIQPRKTRDTLGPGGTMHVTVRIEQTINDASDPDRVMVDTTRAIRQALQFPIESPTASTHQLR